MDISSTANGRETDIGTSLHAAVEQEAGKQLAGVVLLGDGAQTAYPPASKSTKQRANWTFVATRSTPSHTDLLAILLNHAMWP